jgi:zinc/manganese transport system ATP-binding protein
MSAEPPAVDMRGAEVRLGERTIWHDVTLRIEQGEFVALLGENGSGKSTLLKVLLGSLRLRTGEVKVLGSAPGQAGRSIGYLPQRPASGPGAGLRGRDIVRLGLDGDRWGLPLALGPAARRRGRDLRAQVDRAIELVGAGAYAERAIGECSGGEQQRLLIAQALVRRPSVLILDEPLDSLDLPNQTSVAALLARICRQQGVSVLLVAHDVNPLLSYLDRVVYFGGGAAAVGTPAEVITAETLSDLYGVPIEVLRTADGRRFVVGLPEPPAHHSDRHEHHH